VQSPPTALVAAEAIGDYGTSLALVGTQVNILPFFYLGESQISFPHNIILYKCLCILIVKLA
jgi:hypothetical protein